MFSQGPCQLHCNIHLFSSPLDFFGPSFMRGHWDGGVLVQLVRRHSRSWKQIYLTTQHLSKKTIHQYSLYKTAEEKKIGKLSKSQKVPELRIVSSLKFWRLDMQFFYNCLFFSSTWISFWSIILHFSKPYLCVPSKHCRRTYPVCCIQNIFLAFLLETITIDHKNCNAKWTQLSHTPLR